METTSTQASCEHRIAEQTVPENVDGIHAGECCPHCGASVVWIDEDDYTLAGLSPTGHVGWITESDRGTDPCPTSADGCHLVGR